ncbi:MAG: D-alanyl-D-alanine carboxypeptidase [Rhodobiaceae bacterium]|nr:D-alanyl-D-alanine carboxypeptidase [Rhodobiaceae bacterium]
MALALAACGTAKLPPPPEAGATLDESTVAVAYNPSAHAERRSYAAMVVDTRSGKILYENDADDLRYPASLTKLMTLFIVFEDIKAGRISLDDSLYVSAYAASRPPSRLGLKAGSTITLGDAVQALAVKSANDVAAVIAENVGGSEAAFSKRMTQMAAALGMSHTRYVNASGLPDKQQITTARDMAILGRALKTRHPDLCRYFSARSFTYNGHTYRSTNRLLGKVPGVDGMKTGYIRDSGYNLVASAHRGRKSIIVVVIGGSTGKARNDAVTKLVQRYL